MVELVVVVVVVVVEVRSTGNRGHMQPRDPFLESAQCLIMIAALPSHSNLLFTTQPNHAFHPGQRARAPFS